MPSPAERRENATKKKTNERDDFSRSTRRSWTSTMPGIHENKIKGGKKQNKQEERAHLENFFGATGSVCFLVEDRRCAVASGVKSTRSAGRVGGRTAWATDVPGGMAEETECLFFWDRRGTFVAAEDCKPALASAFNNGARSTPSPPRLSFPTAFAAVEPGAAVKAREYCLVTPLEDNERERNVIPARRERDARSPPSRRPPRRLLDLAAVDLRETGMEREYCLLLEIGGGS